MIRLSPIKDWLNHLSFPTTSDYYVPLQLSLNENLIGLYFFTLFGLIMGISKLVDICF